MNQSRGWPAPVVLTRLISFSPIFDAVPFAAGFDAVKADRFSRKTGEGPDDGGGPSGIPRIS
ncbi:hypothetical protein [Burkholderia sp. BCC0419]|uniref:hypothetical protein n=1 Tax=Burkholderia sp. BCC0419 TaxID=486878 RepID=UPI001589311A|nr:hypothetical protein [Burkholderia sp. BCC0419]